MLLALRVEKFLDKDEILEAYLNVSTFGRNSTGQNIGGVQAAARGIFGVDAKDLNLPQAAFIAGLPQSPFRYTPFASGGGLKEEKLLQPGLNRMKTVLYRMHNEQYITEKEYKEALEYDMVADFIDREKRPYEQYPWLTVEIEERSKLILAKVLAEKDGVHLDKLDVEKEKSKELIQKYQTLASRDIRQNGYHIHTTIHKEIYDKFQEIKDQYNNYGYTKVKQQTNPETGKIEEVKEPVEIGAYLRENQTGKILAFVGGRDHTIEETNHATQAVRPNGSTMKPLLVYAPAMELGKSAPGAIVADIPITVSGRTFRNYTAGRYYGLVSSRKALAHSYNASAVYTYLKIKDQRPTTYLEKMGITSLTEGDHTNVAAALGGLEFGVTLEENTNAFSTFANGGKFIEGYMIEKITDRNGNVIYEHKVEPVDVFSPQTSYLMTDMMRDVLRYGTASSVPSMLKFSADWAGKTGTTNGPNDSWFIASNPNVTFGTWIGYDTPAPLPSGESRRNLGIWSRLINGAYDVAPDIIRPKERFKMPGGIVKRSYCSVSGMLPSKACSQLGLVESDYFNAKFVPTKVDDSLGTGRYVVINGKKYMALESTPEEFSVPGLLLNADFIKRMTLGRSIDPSLLMPDHSQWKDMLVANAKIGDNGKAPTPVQASIANGTIKWTASPSNDVIGYRVYSADGKKVASVRSDASYSVQVGSGAYYVVAVDIAGRESAPSHSVRASERKEEEKWQPQNVEKSAPNEQEQKEENVGAKELQQKNLEQQEIGKEDEKEQEEPTDENVTDDHHERPFNEEEKSEDDEQS